MANDATQKKQLALWSNLQVREKDIVKYQQCVFKSYATIEVFGYVASNQWKIVEENTKSRDFPYKLLVFYPYGEAHKDVAFHFPIDKGTNTVSEQHWSAFLNAQTHPYFQELVQAETFGYWFSTVESLEEEINTLEEWKGDSDDELNKLRVFVQDQPIDMQGTTSWTLKDLLEMTKDDELLKPTIEAIEDDCLAFCSLYALFTKGARTGKTKIHGAVANYFSTFSVTNLSKNLALLDELAGFPLLTLKDENVLNIDDALQKFDDSANKQILDLKAKQDKVPAAKRTYLSFVLGTYRSAMQISNLRKLRSDIEKNSDWTDVFLICGDHFSLRSSFEKFSVEKPQRAKWYKLVSGSLASAVIVYDQNADIIENNDLNIFVQVRIRKPNRKIDVIRRFFFDPNQLKDVALQYALCLTNKALQESIRSTWVNGTVTTFSVKTNKELFYGGDVSYLETARTGKKRITSSGVLPRRSTKVVQIPSKPLFYNMRCGSRYVTEVLYENTPNEEWNERKIDPFWNNIIDRDELKAMSVNVGSGLGVRLVVPIEKKTRDADLNDDSTPFNFENRFFRVVGPFFSHLRSEKMKKAYDDKSIQRLGFTYFQYVNVPLDQLVYWASHYNESTVRVDDGYFESSFTFFVGKVPLPPICGHYAYRSKKMKDIHLSNLSKFFNESWTTPEASAADVVFAPRKYTADRENYLGSNEYVWRNVDDAEVDAMVKQATSAIVDQPLVGSIYRLDNNINSKQRNQPFKNYDLAKQIAMFCNSDSTKHWTPVRAMLIERSDAAASIVVTGGVAYVASQSKPLTLHYLDHYGDDGDKPKIDENSRKKYVQTVVPVIRDVWLALFDNAVPPIYEEAPFRATQFSAGNYNTSSDIQSALEEKWKLHGKSKNYCPGQYTLVKETSESFAARDARGTIQMSQRGRQAIERLNVSVSELEPNPNPGATSNSTRYCWFCGQPDKDNDGTYNNRTRIFEKSLSSIKALGT